MVKHVVTGIIIALVGAELLYAGAKDSNCKKIEGCEELVSAEKSVSSRTELIPSAPTGLKTDNKYSVGIYTSSWERVDGANYYIYATKLGTQYEVSETTATRQGEGDWVKACNKSGCGHIVYFK